MPTYAHVVEYLETYGDGRQGWVADANYTGTGESPGTAAQYARRVLNRYLADVASDAELPVGSPGSWPICATRIRVWDGSGQRAAELAAEELYAGTFPASLQQVMDIADPDERRRALLNWSPPSEYPAFPPRRFAPGANADDDQALEDQA